MCENTEYTQQQKSVPFKKRTQNICICMVYMEKIVKLLVGSQVDEKCKENEWHGNGDKFEAATLRG